MKKLLGLLLAITMAWPIAANADVLKNTELKGEIQTIAFDSHKLSPLYGSGTTFRVLAGLSTEIAEDVRANVLFHYYDGWNKNLDGSTVQYYWDNVTLAEANVVLSNLFCCLEATVGRQFYGDEDSAVMYIGPKHYIFGLDNAPSLDAAKLVYSDDFKTVTALAGKLYYGSSSRNFTLYGLDLKMNLTDTLMAQVYGYDMMDSNHKATVDSRHNGFYGAKVTFAPEAATVSAEYARAFEGSELFKEHFKRSYAQEGAPYLVKLDAALNMDAFTPRASFYYEKGVVSEFTNFQPGLAFGHMIVANMTPSVSYVQGGLRMFNVGVDYAWNKFLFSLDGFSFQDRTAKDSSNWEADLVAKYNHNENVQLFAGVGYIKYSTNWKKSYVEGTQDNTVGQLGMLIKF